MLAFSYFNYQKFNVKFFLFLFFFFCYKITCPPFSPSTWWGSGTNFCSCSDWVTSNGIMYQYRHIQNMKCSKLMYIYLPVKRIHFAGGDKTGSVLGPGYCLFLFCPDGVQVQRHPGATISINHANSGCHTWQ